MAGWAAAIAGCGAPARCGRGQCRVFRHPDRHPPPGPVWWCRRRRPRVPHRDGGPPAELGLGALAVPRISIFLSLLDAHVQRTPVGGEVLAVEHRPGTFHSADLAAASEDNERNSVLIRTAEDMTWWSFRSPG